MADAQTLLALANRCEREEPTLELEAAIARAIGRQVEGYQIVLPWTECTGVLYGRLPNYTRSIDDAVTLVPEGWHLHSASAKYGNATVCLHRAFGNHAADEIIWRQGHHWPAKHRTSGTAKTEAMARCAAALRARAALAKDPN